MDLGKQKVPIEVTLDQAATIVSGVVFADVKGCFKKKEDSEFVQKFIKDVHMAVRGLGEKKEFKSPTLNEGEVVSILRLIELSTDLGLAGMIDFSPEMKKATLSLTEKIGGALK